MILITGSSLSGNSGDSNRTYSVTASDFTTTNLQIFVGGTYLYEGAGNDYTVSGTTITFLNAIFNDQLINILYDSSSTTITNSEYGTPLNLARFMGIETKIPNLDGVEESRLKETIGKGDNSTTIFWIDHAYILAESYTVYYGSNESTTTTLTEEVHYTLDKDLGKLTLTSAGVTLVDTNNMYISYSYCNIELTNTQLQDAINRASKQIDSLTNNHFAVSTDATPDWNQVLDEEQDGKGLYARNYFTLGNYPIPSVSTNLNGDVTADDATITVNSTNGFPSSGYLLIGSDKIAYTGKTTTTFTGCTSVEAHSDGDAVKPYVIEASTTCEGGDISWQVLEEGTEFELDKKTGRVHIYEAGVSGSGTYDDAGITPLKGIPNRFRISYIWGNSSIPNEIVKATLMMACKDIMSMAVRKAHATGVNEFKPSLLDVDKDEIDKIIMKHRNGQYSMC